MLQLSVKERLGKSVLRDIVADIMEDIRTNNETLLCSDLAILAKHIQDMQERLKGLRLPGQY